MTPSLVRRLAPFLAAAGVGCGVSAPEIATEATCTAGSVPVVLEKGVATRGSAQATCSAYGRVLDAYRGTFEESWGGVQLESEQWTLRIRAGGAVDSEGHTGITYHHSRIVDIAESVLETFPHELRHVQLGRGSDDHHGWCANFAPWEEQVLGVDERAYLGCPR